MTPPDVLPAEPPFLGQSRIRLVDGLLAVLAEAEARREARWVSLEAPSGWGKTRVAQALYARLAARPGVNAASGADGISPGRYWPATILEATDAIPGDVASRRKRVFPDPARFNRSPGALPGFFWWGIACEQRSCGTASQSLLQDLQQIEAHAVYLDAAWARLASLAERLTPSRAQLGQAGGNLGDELAGHVVGMGLEQLVSAAIPGGGLLLKLARLGVGKAAVTRRHREIVVAGGPLSGDPRPDPVDETLAMLTRLARPGLPVVVFVEDLHRATPLIEELIERLVRSNAALLVITSTWPGELEHHDRLMTLAAEPIIAPRCLRVCHDRPAPLPFPPGAGLDALAPKDLAELVRANHPHTDPETLARLAARFNNPLPLELICTLPKYRRTGAQGGALKLDPTDIERLPRRVEDIYRALWDELPEPAQQALALATLAIPDGDAAWHRAIAARSVADCLEIPAHEALGETLAQDRVPHGWVRALADWQRRFNEPDQLAIAAAARNEHFLADDLKRVLDRLAAALVAHPLADPDPEAQHCARLLLSLHRQSGGTAPGRVSDSDALRAVRLLQQSYADQPHELPARIALGRILDGLRVDADSLNLLEARADYAMALGESGRVEAAEAALSALLVDQTRILGPDHPYTLGTRSNIALLSGRVRRDRRSPDGLRGRAHGSDAHPRSGPSGYTPDAHQHRLLAGGVRRGRRSPEGLRGAAGGSYAHPRPGPSDYA
jgi:hypothetical protein